MHRSRLPHLALALVAGILLLAVLATGAQAQATRTWVSGTGDDGFPCSRTAPCKTLAGAISKTVEAGQISALDPGGYGAVTITKAITIDLTATGRGGVLHTGSSGIVVNAGDDDEVVLRGLDVHGGATTTPDRCGYGGTHGVSLLRARSLRVEDSSIASSQTGVRIAPTGGAPDVLLNRVDIGNHCTAGVDVAPSVGASADVTVRDSTVFNTGIGVRVADRGRVRLTDTTVFGNAVGLQPLAGGILDAFSDVRVFGNDVDGTPTSVPDAPSVPATPVIGPAGPAGPAGRDAVAVPGPAGPAGPPGEAAIKLMVAAVPRAMAARAGSRVRLAYVSTAGARATLAVRKGARTVATVRAATRAGRNTISWNGRVGKRRAKAGAYSLALTAAGPDGQVAVARVPLRLR